MTYQTPENFAAQREIDARCRCGWAGKAPTELTENMATRELVCPRCMTPFNKWPHPNAHGQSSPG